MFRLLTGLLFIVLAVSTVSVAQNTNSSTTRPAGSNTNRKTAPPAKAPAPAPAPAKAPDNEAPTPPTAPRAPQNRMPTPPQAPGSTEVVASFNRLLDGIRKADVNAVTAVYWNSPRLALFNNNGTVTKGWDQMRKNRESSYPDLKDVKLDVKDVAVTMLGRDGALVTALWTQSQIYKGTPESASGRMTLVFKRVGKDWKAVHLHTSPDKEDPSRVLPSEQTMPTPTPTPPSPN